MEARRIKAEPFYELVPKEEPKDLNPEDACGEMRKELEPERACPGAYQRARLALFILRKFGDPLMAAASLIPPSRHGEFLKAKDSALINRCNLYDFYKAAERYLHQYAKDAQPDELRCFCEHFLKVERYGLHARKTMSDSDERRLARDRLRYLRALNGMLDEEVGSGRMDRLEIEAAMGGAGGFPS